MQILEEFVNAPIQEEKASLTVHPVQYNRKDIGVRYQTQT